MQAALGPDPSEYVDDFFPGENMAAEPGDETQLSDVPSEEQLRGRGKKRMPPRADIGSISKKPRREPKEPVIKRARPQRRPIVEPTVEDPNCLYEVVRQGKSALPTVVDEWIEIYKQDRDAALLDLMQFFIQCSGCRGKITAQMQEAMEHAQIIRKMTEEFDEETGDYPLILPGPQWKKFRINFCEFVQVLVRQCQYSIIYDQYLMDNIISLLTGLSDSQVRAFRHTATLAAMKLMTALVDVALNLSINLDNTQRQYEAERQKNRDKRASERLELLMNKRQELEENTDEIKNMLTYMFKSVFVHRYRDTLPEIRSICMSEIGVWMKKFHQNFLDDSYLKYIGWTLHDKVGDVRLKCLQALQPLYSSEELTGKLELFTNKFKDRIVAMTLDKEFDVAVQAVKLVISILKWNTKTDANDPHQKMYHRDILSDKDCEHVYELVYSSHRAVAQAAGEFLNERLFTPDEEQVKGLKTKRGKKRSVNTPLIRDLVQFFIESELHEHGAYLVDSLIESNPMMKDWECMTDLLLEEPGPEEEPLDDRQETSLIEIMVCCVKQSATGEPPVGRGPNRKQLSAKEAKQVQDDKLKLTEHFIGSLPLLLGKYLADPEKIANLMIIPQYFDLEIYMTSRQENNLDLLLKLINEIVDKHTDSEVLEACSKTYEALCSEEFLIHSRCEISRSTLIDSLVHKYQAAWEEYNSAISGREELTDDDIFALTSSMKKVAAFYYCHNLGAWGLWDSLLEWVKQSLHDETVPAEVSKHAVACCTYAIMWDLSKIDDNCPNQDDMALLQDRLHKFMHICQAMIKSQVDALEQEAFTTICDLLIVFCKQLGDNPNMKNLIYEPDRQLEMELKNFIQTRVFAEDSDDEQDEHVKIEELHKRRNFLASFCKLVVYNVISVRVASEIFKHYVKFYNDYGDIIKATLGKAREINKVNCAKTMALSLTTLFKDLPREQGGAVDRQSDTFSSTKELAKRFALSFGLDQLKNRDAVFALHREGIVFSVTPWDNPEDPGGPPPNIAFLELLCEFTNKLMKVDKRVVAVVARAISKGAFGEIHSYDKILLLMLLRNRLLYLEKHLTTTVSSYRGDDWQPLLMYRNSLVHGESDIQQPKPAARQYRGKKRGLPEEEGRPVEEADPEAEERASEHGSEHEFQRSASRNIPSRKYGQQLSNSAVRNPQRQGNRTLPDEDHENYTPRRKKRSRSPYEQNMRLFIVKLSEVELPDGGMSLLDGLMQSEQLMMTDWRWMTNLIFEDTAEFDDIVSDKEVEPLNEAQKSLLIDIMHFCAKRAVGTKSNRKLRHRRLLTEHFSFNLPMLFEKYCDSPKELVKLLSLIKCFDFKVYTGEEHTENFHVLLKYLDLFVTEQGDPLVVSACAEVYSLFSNETSPVISLCLPQLKKLIENLVSRYEEDCECYETMLSEQDDVDSDTSCAVMSSLKKIASFYKYYDLGPWDIWTSTINWLEQASFFGTHVTVEVAKEAMACCTLSVMMDLEAIDERSPVKEQMVTLKGKLEMLFAICLSIMFNKIDILEEEAYLTVCDLLIVFDKKLANNPLMKPLVYVPNPQVETELKRFLDRNVFCEDVDEDDDEIQRNRNFLASYCKLIIYHVLPLKSSGNVLKYYVHFQKEYGDIVEHTMKEISSSNRINCAKMMSLTLVTTFEEIQNPSEVDLFLDSTYIKMLAKKFSVFLQKDRVKNREAVASVHQDGIHFVLALWKSQTDKDPKTFSELPPRIDFFTVLKEFIPALLDQDKGKVVKYLESYVRLDEMLIVEDKWRPLLRYRDILLHFSSLYKVPQLPNAYACWTSSPSLPIRGSTR